MNNSKIKSLETSQAIPPRGSKSVQRLFVLMCLLALATSAFSQAPGSFSFQGVARDASGKVVVGEVNLRFTIHKGSESGPVVHSYESSAITNSSGIFNTLISQVPHIDWSSGVYYLQTEIAINPNDLTDFSDLGSTRLRSVPYALYSNEAIKLSDYNPIIQIGDPTKGGAFPTIGTGARLIWHPQKAAFRAGSLTTNLWEDQEIGENSFAAGKDVWAKGNSAIALGLGTVAKVNNSISLGSYNDNSDLIHNNESDRLFEIGNGFNNANRKNALTILKSGNVGIGQNSLTPQYVLDTDGRIRIKHKNGETAGIVLNSSSNGPAEGFVGMANDNEIAFRMGGKWLLVANKNGTVYMDNYYLTSDKRKKTDFMNLSGSLGKLMQVKGYHYRWLDKTQSQELQTGLIAQEVEKLFPELVNTNEAGNKSLNYNGLIPHLIEALKELETRTDEIAVLRKEIKKLKMTAAQQPGSASREGTSTGK